LSGVKARLAAISTTNTDPILWTTAPMMSARYPCYLMSEAQEYNLPYKERSGSFREDKIGIMKALTVDRD
jgi:hypothetical protein